MEAKNVLFNIGVILVIVSIAIFLNLILEILPTIGKGGYFDFWLFLILLISGAIIAYIGMMIEMLSKKND